MKRKIYLQAFGLLLSSLLLTACPEKEDTPPANDGAEQLTEDALTMDGHAVRLWFLYHQVAVYYNAQGGVDSTSVPDYTFTETDAPIVRFQYNPSRGDRIYSLEKEQPLGQFLPFLGYWALSADGKKMTFSKNTNLAHGGPGGVYDIEFNLPANRIPLVSYPDQIFFYQTENLPGGRKVEKTFVLVARFKY